MRPRSTSRDSRTERSPDHPTPTSTSDAIPNVSQTDRNDARFQLSDSDSEHRPKKKVGRKPRPKISHTAEDDIDDQSAGGKSKRISWGAYPQQTAFLENTLDDILRHSDKKQRRALKKKAKKEFHKKWPTLGEYTRDEVEKSINNWFKNHIQFPHLRKNKPATVPDSACDSTDDDGGPSFTKPAPTRAPLSDATSLALAPLLKSIRRRARGPSGWWALEHRAEVAALRAKLGGDIGALKLAVRDLYNGISDAEKASWEEKAADEKEKQSQDETQCFRNQDDFPLLVATLLGSFIGYEPQQVGSAIIHFRMAMRTEGGAIEHDQYTVGLPDDADPFDVFAGGPKQDEIDRWANYVDVVLPQNPRRRDERLLYQADGLPKLPPYDDEWTVSQARSALEAWFQAIWNYGLENGVDLPNGLDWSNFANTVAPHVPVSWADRVDSKPADRPFHHVVTLYHDLFEAQDTSNAFRWTSSASSRPTGALSANSPAPPTPSRTMYTTYTTPTKSSLTSHAQTADGASKVSSFQPLPRLVFPTATDDRGTIALGPSSAADSPLGRDDAGSAAEGSAPRLTTESMVGTHASFNADVAVDSSLHNHSASLLGDNATDVGINTDAPEASQTSEARTAPSLGAESCTDPAFRHALASSTVDRSVASAGNPSQSADGGGRAENDGATLTPPAARTSPSLGTESSTDPAFRHALASSAVDGSVATASNTSQSADGATQADNDGAALTPEVEDLATADESVHVSESTVAGDGGSDSNDALNDLDKGPETATTPGKRKRLPRLSAPASKRPKGSAAGKELENVSSMSRRAVRPGPSLAGSPRKTRAVVEREAREARAALANGRQTRSRK